MAEVNRLQALKRFYLLLDRLSACGLALPLTGEDDSISWPGRGVYFLFEPGEVRSDTGTGLRVVRVGTHALKASSKSSLRGRMRQHRGKLGQAGGNHRGSIFRLLVGLALANQNPKLASPTWTIGSSAGRDIRTGERELEAAVSQVIAQMRAVLLPVQDEPGPDSLRGLIERNAIALLSNFNGAPLDHASNWLGAACPRERVQRSGLWNNNHVSEGYDPAFLDVMERLIENYPVDQGLVVSPGAKTGRTRPKSTPSLPDRPAAAPVDFGELTTALLGDTLILIPCSGRKLTGGVGKTNARSILDDLSPAVGERLAEARRALAQEIELDETATMPAWRRYAGGLYTSSSPKLGEAIERGRLPHLLILSGGYGVVKAEDLTGTYNARLVLNRWSVGLLETVIADYARRKGLRHARLFAGGSTDYARVLRRVEWRKAGVSDALLYTPQPTTGALVKAPRALGEFLAVLLTGDFLPDWRSSDGVGMRAEQLT